jgi:DNA-binding MarR family transcriptional regulator
MALKEKIGSAKIVRALSFWNNVTKATLKDMPVDLSSRQTAVMLTVYLVPPPHSVKSLSDGLKISKPAICRAIDVLENERLVKRTRNRHDNRNVIIQRTAKGAAYLNELADIILSTSKDAA